MRCRSLFVVDSHILLWYRHWRRHRIYRNTGSCSASASMRGGAHYPQVILNLRSCWYVGYESLILCCEVLIRETGTLQRRFHFSQIRSTTFSSISSFRSASSFSSVQQSRSEYLGQNEAHSNQSNSSFLSLVRAREQIKALVSTPHRVLPTEFQSLHAKPHISPPTP
jgi:hypothetical protein